MNRRQFLAGGAAMLGARAAAAASPLPNIVFIYADDIGYGDLSCYGATRVQTPNLDRLAARGIRFTDAHSSAATCTPSRYSLMTGEYTFRKPGTNVLPGDASLIIEPGRTTLASHLRSAGYKTGCVGKWHLGLGNKGGPDWNGDIKPGPLELGFDYSFIIPATGDRVPCVYVENHRVAGLNAKDPIAVQYGDKIGDGPTGKEHPEHLKIPLSHGHDMTIVNGISRIGYMTGGRSALWSDEDMAGELVRRGRGFIEQNQRDPFFLYLSTHDIHVPRVPRAEFRGTTQCGVRCEVISQLDWTVGEIVETLRRRKLLDNTLLMFTSDNGPVIDDGYADRAPEDLNGHNPSGPLRGGKYSPYEGGTRVPFIAHWPARIKPGVSDALLCQIDMMASLGALAGRDLPASAAPDSFDVLPSLLGRTKRGREHLIEQAAGRLALRQGLWRYVAPAAARAGQPAPAAELYNLAADLAEANNLAAQHPERLAAMAANLNRMRTAGRTRP